MRYRSWLLGLALTAPLACASIAAADSYQSRVVPDTSTITVDALPLSAEVRLDGVPIGTAQDLLARVIAVTPGKHVLHIDAPGYLPTIVNVASTPDWASRIFVQLIPDRNK